MDTPNIPTITEILASYNATEIAEYVDSTAENTLDARQALTAYQQIECNYRAAERLAKWSLKPGDNIKLFNAQGQVMEFGSLSGMPMLHGIGGKRPGLPHELREEDLPYIRYTEKA